MTQKTTYKEKLHSKFFGIMQWDDCDKLFNFLQHNSQDWYVYDLNENSPTTTLESAMFIAKITEIKGIIKELHQERYCGIIYGDDLQNPTMVKIFHPNNLGKSCGSSENPPLPRWIISKLLPETIELPTPEKQGFISKFFK